MVAENPTFDEVFLSHYDRVFYLLLRIVGSPAEAEELAQEVFLRLHRHFDDVELERVSQWLHRVSSNLGLNAIRGRKRWHTWQQKAIEWHKVLQSERHDPVLATTVRRVLARLPERQAELLLLHTEGWSYEELAEALGVKRSSISQLLARARQAFEQTYHELHDTTGDAR